jgi:hypothetical protein
MAFLKKEVLYREAERLGITFDEDTKWPTKNKIVIAALKEDGKAVTLDGEIEPIREKEDKPKKSGGMSYMEYIAQNEPEQEEPKPKVAEKPKAKVEVSAKPEIETKTITTQEKEINDLKEMVATLAKQNKEIMSELRATKAAQVQNENVSTPETSVEHYEVHRTREAFPKFCRTVMSPEIRPAGNGVQLFKYDEELGDDVNVEEISYKDDFNHMNLQRDQATGTYKIKGKTGRKVIAQSTIPKENAGVSYNPETDIVPVVTADGKSGYIYTHSHYPNVKELLMASGQYHKYKDLFNSSIHPENIWYAAGKMLVCRKDVVEYVFSEIERTA